MSRSARVTLNWADGEHEFRLAIGQLRELQEKCNAGPPTILQRLAGSAWFVDDIRETLRLGLIGGGMAPASALSLVQRYVDERPLIENAKPAQAVLIAALVGVDDETDEDSATGKKAEAAEQTTSIQEAGSASPQSMGPDKSSASTPATSTT